MIGNLTIEKANLNMSYMLAPLKILNDAGGELTRSTFIDQMASFMGAQPARSTGEENRVPYNKTKFDRYFGFIDVKSNGNLLLTPRGLRIVPFVVERNGASPDEFYTVDPAFQERFRELFLDSCCFDSFGSYNCGAESSNSDIEPPRVILKSLKLLGEMTDWELGYVLWGLDTGQFDSYDSALKIVEGNRVDASCDYPTILKQWGKINLVTDFKMLDLFSDRNVGIVEKTTDGKYRISGTLSEEEKLRITHMNPISSPMQMFLESCYSKAETLDWIKNAVLGRFADQSMIFMCELSAGVTQCKQLLAKAINAAYFKRRVSAVDDNARTMHQNATVTFIVTGLTGGKTDMDVLFSGFASSFARKDDFKAKDHGWTDQPGQDNELYDFLIKDNPFAKRFGQGNIVLPANLNIIGVK